VLDLLYIFLSLPVILPLMLGITLWIKLASNGPVLFRQERIGRNGKRFVLYKFRSMYLNADTRRHQNYFRNLVRSNKPMVKMDLQYDARVIPGGCLLRASGLDELPQLINVLLGEMSLVGPRPCLVEEYCFFTARQRERFDVLPGLTGIWQVQGKGTATFNEMNVMDTLYVRRASPGTDLGIILRTPLTLIGQLHQACLQHRAARARADLRIAEEIALGQQSQPLS
jgi:lipopolysaccharide/colanic/teichoic acid biosynthesis glycosyltransferase